MTSSGSVVGVDVGGTFTDVVAWDGARLRTDKLPTTMEQGEGVATAISDIGTDLLLHGTTIATNTLLERKGARTVLVTSAGFEDAIEIGRQVRPSLYDTQADRPAPLVDRADRHGYRTPEALLSFLAERQPEAIAVSLLDAYRDSSREGEIAGIISARGGEAPSLSLSSRVNPAFREYERTATTVLNAYLEPAVAHYLHDLERRLGRQVRVMQSSGGLTSAAGASQLAASILLSGPAGGVVAAAACGQAHGWDRVISFDMGGTSTDVCRIDRGQPTIGAGRTIAGYVCRLPSVAVHTIGAGGGSIGWIDPGGGLRVGPHSAGAWPGPACYGRGGTVATVTDANLVLGRLGGSLAGDTQLDLNAAKRALARLGDTLGLSVEEVARGMIEIVNAQMVGAIRRVSVEEGADPRTAALIAFGGAGGLHATALAKALGMSAVLVPPHAGVFSALGLLLSPLRHDANRSLVGVHPADLGRLVSQLEEEAQADMRTLIGVEAREAAALVEARYVGQGHETPVPYAPGEDWRLSFEVIHRTRNGFFTPEVEVELVNLRVAVSAPALLEWDRVGGDQAPGQKLVGPTVLEARDSTAFLDAGERLTVLDDGTMEITW